MNINFSIDRIKGFEKATDFAFSIAPSPLSAVTAIRWVFDDGHDSTSFTPTHVYLHEGTYNPTVYVYTTTSMVSATTAIRVAPYIDESIYFDFVPPPAFAGHINRYPFSVNITSKITDKHTIDLSAMFSRSYKHQEVVNKWGFLRPEWRFLDLAGKIIDTIDTTDSLIKIDADGNLDPNGTVVGVSGNAQFYFVDDIYNYDLALAGQPFTTIIVTLETDKVPAKQDYLKTKSDVYGFANSKSTAFFPYITYYRTPQQLKITENGIQYHTNPKWVDAQTPLVVNSIFTQDFPDDSPDGNGASDQYKSDENFAKYLPINNSNIPLTLKVSNLDTTFIPSNTQYQLYDSDGYKVAGYYKGSFLTDTLSALNCVISASANIPVPALSCTYAYPILWLSNPEAKKLHTAQYFYQSNFGSASATNLNKAQIFSFDIPIVEPSDYSSLAMAVTGFHGVLSIAVTPFPDFHAWAADSEKNWIYKYATTGAMLCAIDLNKVVTDNKLGHLIDQQVSPASIVLDGSKNLWVTLYDTVSTLKFDSYGNFLFAITPISSTGYKLPPSINSSWFASTQYYPSSATETGDNNLIEPTGIESDTSDNVWVSYSYYASSYMVKYDKNGTLLTTITYPVCSCPQEIVCDKNNNIWTVLSDTLYGDYGKIEKRNNLGVLLSSFGNLRQPNHATVDQYQNLWFTYDYNKVGKISNYNGTVSTVTVASQDIGAYKPDYWFDKTKNTEDTVFDGISVDYRGNVYVINTIENQIYVLDQTTMLVKDKFMVNPQGFEHYIEEPYGPTITEYNPIGRSLRAQGDWSGFKWINKYGPLHLPYFPALSSTLITGNSQSLNYYKTSPYDVYKINENFDLTAYMKNMSFMPTLIDSAYLYDTYLTSIYGKDGHEDFGVKAYEKIANFLINTVDIDTANVDQLYNLSEMVDLTTDDFQLNYPESIKRIINLASINESRLWGSLNDKELDVNKLIYNSSPINTTTFMVTAGIPMVLKTKSLGTYRIIPTGPIYTQNVYSIVYLVTSLGLDGRDWRSEYEFFVADQWKDRAYTNGIIDWTNPNTTISPTLSTACYDWSADQGILETMLSYELLKGLDILP